MKKINDGGPAFPMIVENGTELSVGAFGHEVKPGEAVQFTGLSKRDYFAAKAMQGMLAAPYQPASDQFMLARDAYTVADAMIAEGSK